MKKEFIKVMAIAAVCVGTFTAAIFGANHLASAAPADTPLPLANSPATSYTQEMPEMTLNVLFNSDTTPSAHAKSPEDAAHIGAQYIWDMFGESIDGATVHMMYRAHPSMTTTFWSGIVTHQADTSTDDDGFANLLLNHAIFEFTIDAVSGKRIDVIRTQNQQRMSAEVQDALNALWERNRERGATEEMIALRSGGPPPTNLDDYKQAAKEIAAIQFATSEIYSIEFRNAGATMFDLDANGNIIVTARQLMFTVTDSTGHTADIAIDELTKELRWVFTAQNYIDPNFDYTHYASDRPSIG